MLKKLLSIAFMVLLCVPVFSQGNKKNIDMVSHLTYPQRLSDVWAYVDGSGNEYALVGTETGLSIVDLRDPANPAELQFMPGVNTIWRDAIVYNDHAYVSNEGGNGIIIMDLSTLPGQVMWKDTVMGNNQTAHNIWQADGFLYLVGGNVAAGGMEIYDLRTDPWNPTFAGSYTGEYVHDVYVRGNLAYAAEINTGNLTVLDISDKANIQILGTRTYQNAQTHNTWLNDAGDVCITTDELARGYLIAWDVSDPTDMKELDRIRSSLSAGNATPHNAHFINDYVVTSYYADGINIMDANRPGNMVEVGYYDTAPEEGGGFVGCWGAYPYLPSGLILAADIFEGLYILNPTYTRACYLEGTITDASNANPLLNVQVEIAAIELEDFSETNGDYAVGYADAGSYTVTYSKYGYEPETYTVSLTNGMVTMQDVQLTPSTPVTLMINVVDAVTNSPIEGAGVAAETFGFSKKFASDASGQVTEANFLTGQYDFVAGKWGYVTTGVDYEVTTSGTQVTISLEKGYYDDYIFDYTWIVDASSTSGNWERGEPKGTDFMGFPINPDFDTDDDFGDQAYITGNQGVSAFDDLVGQGKTSLISPAMDLSTYIEPILTFQYVMLDANPNNGALGNDTLYVEVIDGANVTIVNKISEAINGFWSEVTVDLTSLNLGNNVRVRFSIEDKSPMHLVEAGIDKFQISEGSNVAIDPELIQQAYVSVYPNPAGEKVFVDFDFAETGFNTGFTFEVVDIQGRSLRRNSLSAIEGSIEIDFDLASGVYLGILKHEGEVVKTVKIVK